LHATPPSAHPPQAQYNQVLQRQRPMNASPIQNIRYSDFLKLVKQRRVEKVTFDTDGTQLVGQLHRPKRSWFSRWFRSSSYEALQMPKRIRINQLPNDPELLTTLSKYNVDISVSTLPKSTFKSILSRLLFPLSLFASLFFLMRRSNPLNGSALSLAKMKPTYNFYPQTNITFEDVAGCDGAKLELAEVVDFLRNPVSYTLNGCIIPKGVLLYGPPGTFLVGNETVVVIQLFSTTITHCVVQVQERLCWQKRWQVKQVSHLFLYQDQSL
jgi:cell division protease FtsH